MGKGKRKQTGVVNRILGFAGRATDEEVDEVIELAIRMVYRMLSSQHFVKLLDLGAELQQVSRRFDRFGNG